MKKTMWLLFLALPLVPATAQHADHYHHSVFSGLNHARPAASAPGAANRPSANNTLPGWIRDQDPLTGLPRGMFGPAVTVRGNTLDEKATDVVRRLMPSMGMESASWRATHANTAPHAAYAYFDQYFSDHKVAFARLTLRFTTDGRLLRIREQAFGEADGNLSPVISPAEALRIAAADLEGARLSGKRTPADWEWFPVPSGHGFSLHPAWPFELEGSTASGTALYLTGYVDALDGQLLYRDNQVKETFDLRVTGAIYPLSQYQPPVTEPLANLSVEIGSSYFTDTAGLLEIPSLNPPQNTTISLQGRWAEVRAQQSGDIVPSFTYTAAANGTTYHVPADRFVNAYYHVDKIHGIMKDLLPGFTALDAPMRTNVDVNGTCNAFYNGGSNTLNFLQEGNGCNSFAHCSDIIYHEYGHAIANRFYTWRSGSWMRNGALNEGHADIWALGITHNAVLGSGAYAGGGGFIRRYDQAPKVFPQDIRGEVHADGEIIAGAWWDLGVNMGSVDSMMKLFAKTWYDTPDGPTGMEGAIYHDVLISALLNDDDDNDLRNGTPNMDAIVSAFARHGIYLLFNATVTHEEVPHHPAGAEVAVRASVSIPADNLPLFGDIRLFFRERNTTTWDSVTMTPDAPGSLDFTATIPGKNAGTLIDYYFVLYDLQGVASGYAPAGYRPDIAVTQSTIPYQFGFGLAARQKFDFETEVTGWQIGNTPGDNATGGIWERAIPLESYQNTVMGRLVCQTGADHTTGAGYCLVTANPQGGIPVATNINAADVDNGVTSVITPVFDLSGFSRPVIEYYRWFSNDRGTNARTDPWQVMIRDGNSQIWIQSVENTYQSDYNWRRRVFAVRDHLPNSTSIQMKFIASDRLIYSMPDNGQGTVEAAVDDFRILDTDAASGVDGVRQEDDRISLYPNPADKSVHIQTGNATEGTITLSDLTGRVISQLKIGAGTAGYELPTGQLVPGQYLVTVQTGREIYAKKITVRH